MKMDHNFIEQQLLVTAPTAPRRSGKGQAALVIAALIAAALAVATVPDPHPAVSAPIADIA